MADLRGMLKISYVHARQLPSTEANGVHVMSMCEAFAANGNDVQLLVPGTQRDVDLPAWYGVAPNFRIRFVARKRTSRRPRLFSAAALWRAALNGSDLIYTRDPLTAAMASALRFPTIFEAHNPLRPADRQRIERASRSRYFRRMVVISGALRQIVRQQSPDCAALHRKLLVAHDAARLSEEVLAPARPSRFTAVYAGSFYQGRGIELILRMAERTPDIRYLLVGGDEAKLLELTGSCEAAPNVELGGYRAPNEIASILASADVLLAPYQSRTMQKTGKVDQAGYMSPLKIFEYMAAGKPIICSALPVLQEVLVDGRTALLPAPDDLTGWVAAIRSIRDDQELAQRLARNARIEAVEHHSWPARAKAVLEKAVP